MVKQAKQATKNIEKLHILVDFLRFYMYSSKDPMKFKKHVIDPAQEIEDYIREISSDKKIDNVRLVKRWEARQKRLEEQNIK